MLGVVSEYSPEESTGIDGLLGMCCLCERRCEFTEFRNSTPLERFDEGRTNDCAVGVGEHFSHVLRLRDAQADACEFASSVT